MDDDLFVEVDNEGNYVSGPLTRRNIINARLIDPEESLNYEPFTRTHVFGPNFYPYLDWICAEIRKVDGVWTDVFVCRGHTADERQAKIDAFREQWWKEWGFESWRWVEDLCYYMAPVEPPKEIAPPGKKHIWNEIEKNWVLVDKTDTRKFIK